MIIFNNTKIPSRDDIVKEAYTWIGVPYVDGQHSKFGCDCVGLVIGVSKALNYLNQSWKPEYYSPQWHLHGSDELLLETLEYTGCVRKNIDDRLPGDILTFQFQHLSAHAGFFMPKDTVIHSLVHQGVVHHGLRWKWHSQWLKSCWQLPGISNEF